MFVVSFTYADHIEPFANRIKLLGDIQKEQQLSSCGISTTTRSNKPEQDEKDTFVDYHNTHVSHHPSYRIRKDVFQSYKIHQARGSGWDLFLPDKPPRADHHDTVQASLLPHTIPTHTRKGVFAIEGSDRLTSKDGLWSALVSSHGREHAGTIMPPTYILTKPDDEKRFLEDYVPGAKYICKKGLPLQADTVLTDNLDTLMRSRNDGYTFVQKYVTNRHVVDGGRHLLLLKLYVLIVCEPKGSQKKVYVHRQGRCLYTTANANKSHPTWETCSEKQPQPMFGSPITGEWCPSAAHLPRTFDELRLHWKKCGVSYEEVMCDVHRSIQEAVSAVLPDMCKGTQFQDHLQFQLFDVDVALEGNRSPKSFVLKFTEGPLMTPTNQADYAVHKSVLEDVFRSVGLIQGSVSPQFVRAL